MITSLFPVDPDLEIEQQTSQTWHIEDWNKLEKKFYWPTFECGRATWCVFNMTPTKASSIFLTMHRRILMYPSGNGVDFVSMYLEAGPKTKKEQDDWYACAEFAIVLWNPNQPSKYVSHGNIVPQLGRLSFIYLTHIQSPNTVSTPQKKIGALQDLPNLRICLGRPEGTPSRSSWRMEKQISQPTSALPRILQGYYGIVS